MTSTANPTGREQVTRLVESNAFQRVIISVIIFNAVTLGLETSDAIVEGTGGVLHVLDRTVVVIFVVASWGNAHEGGDGSATMGPWASSSLSGTARRTGAPRGATPRTPIST